MRPLPIAAPERLTPCPPARSLRWLGFATLGLALWGCAPLPTVPGAAPAMEVTGAGDHRTEFSRTTSLGVVSVPAVEAHVQMLLRRLLQGSTLPPGAPHVVRVAISASPTLGAWSTDDTIYLPWRLLTHLETDEDLAALLAHEASHVLLRHATLDSRSSLFGTLSAFGPLLLAGTPFAAVTVAVGGQYGDRAVAAGWARDQELEADALGVRLLAGAGIRPSAMLDLLDLLAGLAPAQKRPRPGPATVTQNGRVTEVTIQPGAMRFGDAENSHPDLGLRRERIRQVLQGPPSSPPAGSSAPPGIAGWPDVRNRPEVNDALDGLAAAHAALQIAAGTSPGTQAQAQAQARKALGSPVGGSFVAYWSGVAVLPGETLRQLGLMPIRQRLRQKDTPVAPFLALLAYASNRGDWATAADVADQLRERFEPDRGLYRTMANVYAQRAQQIAAYVNANMQRLGAGEALSLNGERIQRELQGAKMLTLCMAAAKTPNDIADVCQR